MNITQLKYVIVVAGSSSMREASSKLYVTQPALSASIRELEDELGIIIFERTNKGVSITDDGHEFLTYAKKAVGQYEILEDRYLSRESDREIFSVSTQHYNFAIKAFAELIRKVNPTRYLFSIHETKTKEVLDDVGRMKSEVGVISFSGSNETLLKKMFREYRLDFTPLMIKDTFVYVWKDNIFAGRESISLEEMRDCPCISFDQSNDGNFYISEEAMSDYSFDKMIRSDDRATTMELIAGLGGYSIGCGMLSQEDSVLQGLAAVKMKEEDPLTIGFITRKGNSLSEYGSVYVNELLRFKEI
ncbi:MAG: LysR family transcriptional regulator [Clostridia bacterium]|nr:LysR family transcriptional regulator [Clostridia bacterium]